SQHCTHNASCLASWGLLFRQGLSVELLSGAQLGLQCACLLLLSLECPRENEAAAAAHRQLLETQGAAGGLTPPASLTQLSPVSLGVIYVIPGARLIVVAAVIETAHVCQLLGALLRCAWQ